MPLFPGFGSAQQGSELDFLLKNMLNGMGDYITKDQGSMAWVEALVIARMLNAALNFGRLMAAQLDPSDASIFLQRWKNIYVAQVNDPLGYIQQIELETNTPPNVSNIQAYIAEAAGVNFLDLQWIPLQNPTFATFAPPADGYTWSSVVSTILAHLWRPRDLNDNFLQSYSDFELYINNWQLVVKNWVPANCDVFGCVFTNAGGDGYGNSDFQDGYNNPVTASAGSFQLVSTLSSSHSTFETDFKSVFDKELSYQPIEIVDDSNIVHTFYVVSVQDATHLTLSLPLPNNITARTYRTYGIALGISGLGTSVFN